MWPVEAAGAQTAEEVHGGSDRKVPQYTEHAVCCIRDA